MLPRKNLHIPMMMMNNLKFIILLFFFWISFSNFAQENIKHTVVKGETITNISQKYNVTPSDIYSLNPEVLNGLQENSILIIPIKISTQSTTLQNENQIIHIVKSGETLYGLSKKYKTTVDILEKANPELKNGLKLEQKLIIPKKNIKKNDNKTNQVVNQDNFTENSDIHIVKAKETLYGISKKYNISQDDLIALNPELKNGLPLGYSIKLKKKIKSVETKNTTNQELSINHKVLEGETLYGISKKYNVNTSEIIKLNPSIENGINVDDILIISTKSDVKANENQNITKPIDVKPVEIYKKEEISDNIKTHKVVAGETIYSIANKYNISQELLIALNPNIKEGLQIDAILSLSGDISNTSNTKSTIEITSNILKTNKILNNSLSKLPKEITIFIPFNIENQEIKSEEFANKLKKDAFLNLAIDFYSGAMIAIDSLKKLNINVKFNILDSNESKNSSNVAIYSNKIKQSNVIIGPFYQNNAEETAKLFPEIPVISPLSKENPNSIKNLYQTMPSTDFVKIKTFEYLSNKNAQIIALIDKNKNNTRTLIKSNFKKVAIIPINEKGNFIADSITYFLKKDKLNYLVIETSSTSFLLNTINTINNIKSKGYNTQLVILDFNKTYESEEIFPKIYKQDFFYPSISKPNESNSGKRFNKIYKQRHSSNASVYSVRGFDVVFDTAIRIAQEESFEVQAQQSITNHLEYKFDYQKNPLGNGYVNKGIYFLKYSKDMKIIEMEE
jgi:LysM repeat protein